MKADLISKIETLPEFTMTKVYIGDSLMIPEEMVEAENFRAIYESTHTAFHMVVHTPIQPVAIVSKYYKLVQLTDALKTAIEKLPNEIDGQIRYWFGRALMDVFPLEQNVGLRVSNSVDGKWALRVDFAAKVGKSNNVVVLPRNMIRSFRKVHKGKVLLEYKDFVEVITQVEIVWDTIVRKMNAIVVDVAKIKEVKEILKAGKQLEEIIDEIWASNSTLPEPSGLLSLWDLFLGIIQRVSKRNYKSDIHRQKKLEKIGKVILNYSFFLEIQKGT